MRSASCCNRVMEDYDDCLPLPDKEGKLDLRYRGWNHLDDTLWTMGRELISLNVAYNNLEVIPPDIANLLMLKHLDVSGNKLTVLPPEIGKLRRLVNLKCSGNKLRSLPIELGKCTLLEELVASENELNEVPASLAELPVLKVLRLQQNKLRRFHVPIALIPTIVTLDLSYNPDLGGEFPEQWLNDTKNLVWICKLHQRYKEEASAYRSTNEELEDLVRVTKETKLRLQDRLRDVTEENKKLLAERPEAYLLMSASIKKVSADVKYHVGLVKDSRACVIS